MIYNNKLIKQLFHEDLQSDITSTLTISFNKKSDSFISYKTSYQNLNPSAST